MTRGPADPKAPTLTVAPEEEGRDQTKSSADAAATDTGEAHVAPHREETSPQRGPGRPRLPAPLQYRDPDRYEVLDEHGRGGIGRVMRARDRELGRSVAIKELLVATKSSEYRFFREALITARLEHPGIVPVHEAGRWPDGTPFYSMKLVQGRPLHSLIDECRSLDDRLSLLSHVIAVADAIAYAHGQKIIHRDLKPSNVIVGAFGETVVIDWGLAKDLVSETPEPDDMASRAGTENNITVAGSVLGTPAYMAPEQHRGHADERSDVYAIGGILVHIFTGAPPGVTDLTVPNVLSIPRDIAAVISRAMKDAPGDRYATAKELAADLRRFTQRQPVSARRYSVIARASLGFTRHRVASLSFLFALVTLSLVLAVYSVRMNRQRERATQMLDDLTLNHAQLLLSSDPTAAMAALASYTGVNSAIATRTRAEAEGLGVATMQAHPHRGTILWVVRTPTGNVVSLSYDGTIATSSPDGTVRVLARDGMTRRAFAYSASRHILAYSCEPMAVCFLDVNREAPAATSIRGLNPADLSFTPDGAKLSVLSVSGILWTVDFEWQGPPILRDLNVSGATSARYVNGTTLAVAFPDRMVLLNRDGRRTELPTASLGVWDINDTPSIAASDLDGHGLLIDVATALPNSVMSRGPKLCERRVSALTWISQRPIVGYACSDGTVGTWNVVTSVVRRLASLQGTPNQLASSEDGTLLAVVGDGDGVLVLDMETGVLSKHIGHNTAITAVAAPTATSPFIVSGDGDGWVRVWRTPQRVTRVLHRFADFRHAFMADDSTVVASTASSSLMRVTGDGLVSTHQPHDATAFYLVPSPNGQRFLAFGLTGFVEIWSLTPLARGRTIQTGQGALAGAWFLNDSETIVTAGTDGRVLVWQPNAGPEIAVDLGEPIGAMIVLYPSDTLVLLTVSGRLVRANVTGEMQSFRAAGTASTAIDRSRNGKWVATGDVRGAVDLFDTSGWHQRRLIQVDGSVRDIEFSTAGDMIAIATRAGMLHVGRRVDSDWRQIQWTEHSVKSLFLAFGQDGKMLVAACNGGLWFIETSRNAMKYISTPSMNFELLRPNSDRSRVVGLAAGALLSVDIEAIAAELKQGQIGKSE